MLKPANMLNRVKLRFSLTSSLVFASIVGGAVDPQSPLAVFIQPQTAAAQVADDESPFADDPTEDDAMTELFDEPTQGDDSAPSDIADNEPAAIEPSPVAPRPLSPPAALTPPGPAPLTAPGAPLAAPGTLNPPGALNAPGSLGGGGFAGLSASLGATRDSYSAAPNMIGDLFNAGTSSLNFQAKFAVRPEFSVVGPNNGVVVTNPSSLVSGVSASITGVQVTSLSNIGDLVRVNDSSFISASDLDPINSVNLQVSTLDDATTVLAGQFSGQTPVRPLAPTSNSTIFTAANRAVARELSTGLGSEINVEEMITLEYIEEESSIGGPFADEITFAEYIYNASVSLPVPSPGEVVGRYSIADNNSPLPQDRLFLDYNFFHNARITAAGIPVSRWAPGFESTFADGLGSIEFRAPMAITLTSAVNTNGDDLAAYEFGDISFTLKGLLHQDERFIASVGMGLTVPTADDFSLTLENNVQVVRVENQSVHLLPFIAGSINVTPNTFVQSFAQLDFDANGNTVFLDEQGFLMQGGGQLTNVGRLKSQSTLRFSNSAGCFLFRNRQKRVSDLAAVLEAHYTGTLNKSDAVGSANFAVGDPTRTLSVLNLTSGLHAYMGKSVVTAAYGVPVTEDRVFDGELRLFINRYF